MSGGKAMDCTPFSGPVAKGGPAPAAVDSPRRGGRRCHGDGRFSREFKLEVMRQLASGAQRPAQVCREHGLANGVLWRWRREYAERGEAAFASRTPDGAEAPGAAHRRAGALLRATGAGERGAKKGARRQRRGTARADRRAAGGLPGVVAAPAVRAAGAQPQWWYERARSCAPDGEAVALRDAIERIVLEFPGYGYRRVTHELRRQGWTVNAQARPARHARGIVAVPAQTALRADHRLAACSGRLPQSAARSRC